jgi:N-acetyl-anhydromuramyl-L-alanine amidase AmpD
MGGLFYHFVIGNGTLSGDGEIEVGWRWRKQEQVNRPSDIQICLVGDFNKQEVSNAQFDTLVKLISILRKQYNIPLSNIRKHKDIEGKITECPGDNFPFYNLLAELRKPNF